MPLADPTAFFEAVLAGSGRALTGVRPVSADADAVRGTVQGFEVGTRAVGEPGDLPVTDLLYVAGVADHDAAGVRVVDPQSGQHYQVWRYPDDPALPALSAAVHPDGADVLLRRIGLGGGEPGLEVISYRPGRRAVIRVVQPSATTYLKVLRPAQVAAVHERHRVMRAAGLPVPEPLGWSPAGLLLLAGLPGVPALEVLPAMTEAGRLPPELRALLDRLAMLPRTWPARRTPVVAVDWYADQLAAVVPGLAERAAALRDVVRAAAPPPGGVTIHGDLHLGQVLVEPDDGHRVVGLLDVDTAGPGHRGDDVSALLANLVAADLMGTDLGGTLTAAAQRALAASLAPPEELADLPVRLAAQLLAHALGPGAQGEVALASRLLARAEAAAVER